MVVESRMVGKLSGKESSEWMRMWEAGSGVGGCVG